MNIIVLGCIIVAIDLFMTFVFHKPLIKAGPIAKSMYPGLENDR